MDTERTEAVITRRIALSLEDILAVTLEKFQNILEQAGYFKCTSTRIPAPYETKSGVLWAKGTFYGPPPYDPGSRAMEDVDKFSFFVLEDAQYADLYVIEVKHDAALLATYLVGGDQLELLHGELPLVGV